MIQVYKDEKHVDIADVSDEDLIALIKQLRVVAARRAQAYAAQRDTAYMLSKRMSDLLG